MAAMVAARKHLFFLSRLLSPSSCSSMILLEKICCQRANQSSASERIVSDMDQDWTSQGEGWHQTSPSDLSTDAGSPSGYRSFPESRNTNMHQPFTMYSRTQELGGHNHHGIPNVSIMEHAQNSDVGQSAHQTWPNLEGFQNADRGHPAQKHLWNASEVPNTRMLSGDTVEYAPSSSNQVYSGSMQNSLNNYTQLRANENVWTSGSFPSPLAESANSGPVNDGVYQGSIDELELLCKEGKVKDAILVLSLLEEKRIVVDLPKYFMLMRACANHGGPDEARKIHNHILKAGANIDLPVNNKILDMYIKCGEMDEAKELFGRMPHRNLTTWDTMILGFANNGFGEEAMDTFYELKKTKIIPDSGLFVSVFSACGVIGAVDEGMLHFESMQKEYGIAPSMEHYVSIVNMLGQSSYLDEALEFIEQMPVEPSIDVWETLMKFCRINGYAELGDRCAQIVERLDASRLDEQSRLGLVPIKASDLAREKEEKKIKSQSNKGRSHSFKAGDRSHPDRDKHYKILNHLKNQTKEVGYVPNTRFVLHDVDQESKEEALLAHSERLALSQALLTSPPRATIRIIKNLRSCGDCHTFFKIISELVGRQIIARDAKRFHHFENGVCSCKDYW